MGMFRPVSEKIDEPRLGIDRELMKKPKKQDATLIYHMQKHPVGIRVLDEQMFDALPEGCIE